MTLALTVRTVLCDAGPLIALIDADDEHHARCVAALPTLPLPLLTTWPCFTEAMAYAGGVGGWPMQQQLWQFVGRGALTFQDLAEADKARLPVLMAQYHDTPMDLADASLVAAAEALNLRRVFTVDSDFYVYRIGAGRQAGVFEIVP